MALQNYNGTTTAKLQMQVEMRGTGCTVIIGSEVTHPQGCGLGLDLTVLRRSRDVPNVSSRTKLSMSHLGLEGPSSRSCLNNRVGLGYSVLPLRLFRSRAQDHFWQKQNAEISSTPWLKILTTPSGGLRENLTIPEPTAHHLPSTAQQAPVIGCMVYCCCHKLTSYSPLARDVVWSHDPLT